MYNLSIFRIVIFPCYNVFGYASYYHILLYMPEYLLKYLFRIGLFVSFQMKLKSDANPNFCCGICEDEFEPYGGIEI